MKRRLTVLVTAIGWVSLCYAATDAGPHSGFLTKDWLLGGALGLLQIVALAYLKKVDTRLDGHGKLLSSQNAKLAAGEVRMGAIEKLCAYKHRLDGDGDEHPPREGRR